MSNLPWTVSHTELRQFFSKFGPVHLATVVFDKNTGLSKNFGFVAFSNRQGYEDVQNSAELKLEGQILKIAPADQSRDSNSE